MPTIDQYDSPGRLDMMKSARASEQLRRGGRRAGSQVVVEFAFRYTGEQDRRTACKGADGPGRTTTLSSMFVGLTTVPPQVEAWRAGGQGR